MSKFGKLSRALGLLLKKPYLLNKILEDKDENKELVQSKYNLPLGLPEVDIRTFVKENETEINPFCFLEGGSLPTDLLLLKSLASSKEGSSYFEIGTWRGESVANVASVAKECYTLNLSDEELRELGLNEKYISLQKHLSRDLKNVNHIAANSMQYDFKALNKKFDLIFIDGDHRYQAVKTDSQNCFSYLRHDKSVIVWHDYKYAPDEVRWEVLLGILDGVPKEFHKHLYGVSNTLCAIYYPFPLEAKTVSYPLKPDKQFSLKIKIES
jgi:predicted O-methyltransferase YrrM